MNFLLVTNENKSHYGYTNDFDRFSFKKQRIKTKNTLARVARSALVLNMY